MFNIPFYISYTDFSNFLIQNFASLQLTDDIKFLSWVIINLSFLYFVIELLKFLKGLIYFIWNKVFK